MDTFVQCIEWTAKFSFHFIIPVALGYVTCRNIITLQDTEGLLTSLCIFFMGIQLIWIPDIVGPFWTVMFVCVEIGIIISGCSLVPDRYIKEEKQKAYSDEIDSLHNRLGVEAETEDGDLIFESMRYLTKKGRDHVQDMDQLRDHMMIAKIREKLKKKKQEGKELYVY